jgi:DNA polymerase I-like protein with 3'-5' exonuclease and polymerase domains
MAQRVLKFDQLNFFIPDSPWVPPTALPDLSREEEVCLDLETRDDSLARDKGPGFYAYEKTNPNTGFICGISAAWRDQSVYIPLRHYDTQCFDFELVQRWLKDLARQRYTRFVFHNFQYDWGWIQATFGTQPPDSLDDTGAMAAMVDENQTSFKLENLCAWQKLPGKDETLLEQAMERWKVPKADIKKHLWRLEGRYVGPYAEQDAASTLALAQKLRPQLTEENLDKAYQVERDLMPLTLRMKQRGIRVDCDKASKLIAQLHAKNEEELRDLSSRLGVKISEKSIRSSRELASLFDNILKLGYNRTAPTDGYPQGQPSFDKEFMAKHDHWVPRTIHRIKQRDEFAEKFLHKFILNHAHKGRVHPSVNQFRGEEGGTRSHRFSYSDPPLQQMPSRDDEMAPWIRGVFLPEDGERWCSIDYRQQEYRLIVFVAELINARKAKIAADRYRNHPETDYHDWVAEITRLPRKRAKDVNFAKSYGAGVLKFALMTGMTREEAEKTMAQYDEELPFVKQAAERYMKYAANNGYIKLIDGARNHFNLWEPIYRDFAREKEIKKNKPYLDTTPCPWEEAERRRLDPDHPWYYEKMKRSYTHKAFNRMIQGSAARQVKKAMVDIYRGGYHPLLQLHDELAFSISSVADAKACAEMMENALPVITIPMLTDVKIGPNWGNLKVEK